MKIREATKKDLKEIAEIFRKESSKKPYNTKYTPKSAIKKIEELFENEVYVAEDKKKIMGFIASNITFDNNKKVFLNELWLRSIYQGKGIGKAFVRFIEKMYKKKGVNIIRLITRKNARAFNFYKKIKYKEVKNFVFMEKKLK